MNIASHRRRESSKPELIETDPIQIFLTAVENCKPVIGVTGMKRAGKVYQVSLITTFTTTGSLFQMFLLPVTAVTVTTNL